MVNSVEIKRLSVKNFIKYFSCAHSMLISLADKHQLTVDVSFLKAATGFGAGVSTMGDVCGMVNGGAMLLGKKLYPLFANSEEQWKIAFYSNEFYNRTKNTLGTCNCGDVHGGKHLAKNFRKAILTGRSMKCFEMLYKGSGILEDLFGRDELEHFGVDSVRKEAIRDIYQHFQSSQFHCCKSTLQKIEELNGLDTSVLNDSIDCFIGGIGFSGTLCGAVVGGVLAIGLKDGVNPHERDYKDTVKIFYQGLLKNDKVWSNEKVFKAAKTFDKCQALYKMVEETYGSCDCSAISSLDVDKPCGLQKFKEKRGIHQCQQLSENIAQKVNLLL